MSVSLDQVIAAASRRLAPLTAECAGHAVLAVADQVVYAPTLVSGEQLSLEENGTIRILKGALADATACEQQLRQLLNGLMRVARGGGGALFRAAMRDSEGDLPRFVRELEAALIPANRAAARRSLARLHRETLRAVESGSLELPMVEVKRSSSPGRAPEPPQAPPEGEAPVVVSSSAVERSTEPRTSVPGAELPAIPPFQEEKAAAVPARTDAEEAPLEIDVHVSPVPPSSTTESIDSASPGAIVDEAAALSTPEPQEIATPLEPIMQRVRERESLLPAPEDDGKTPYLGTRVAQLAPPPLPSVPTDPGPIGDDGATDPMPPVECLDDELTDLDDDALTPYLDRASTAPRTEEPAPVTTPRRQYVLPETRERKIRKSDVSELVQNFQVADPEPSRSLLRDLKSLAGIEPSVTPPPVAVGSDEDGAAQPEERVVTRRAIRPIATVTVVGAMLATVAFAGPQIVNARTEKRARPVPAAAPTAPIAVKAIEAPCQATVEVVGAPVQARIEVRPQGPHPSTDPQWATGPDASFSQLPCGTAFEILVRSGRDHERHWTRVPISAAELSPSSPKGGGVTLEVDVTRRELY